MPSYFSHVPLFASLWTVAPRLLCPQGSLGLNTGVGCHSLLQGIFRIQGSNPGISLLHCRQFLYCVSHQESPPPLLMRALILSWVHLPLPPPVTSSKPNSLLKPQTHEFLWAEVSLGTTIQSIERIMPCKNKGGNLSVLARKIRQTSYILIGPHILQAGIYICGCSGCTLHSPTDYQSH